MTEPKASDDERPSEAAMKVWREALAALTEGGRLDMDRAALVIDRALNHSEAVLGAGEPVAWMYKHPEGYRDLSCLRDINGTYDGWIETPLYTHPAPTAVPSSAAVSEAS